MSVPPQPCPLCLAAAAPFHLREARRRMPARDYHRCPVCALVFVPAPFHLDPAAERAEYDLHRNDPADAGYRRFLGRLVTPLAAMLPAGARGLDYGCGPAPALQSLLHEAGFDCATYDPHYQPDPSVLDARYDFITCTEVAEHFAAPRQEFDRLHALLADGGVLALMTRRPDEHTDFANWHYSRDPTHIAFYAADTLRWIGRHYGMALTLADNDIALLHKRGVSATIPAPRPGAR